MGKAKKLTGEERQHYRDLIAMIIDGDPGNKKHIDNIARMQLAAVKAALPDADEETVIAFMLSIAAIMAKLMVTHVSDIAETISTAFGSNVIATAHALGAYSYDDEDDLPAIDPERAAKASALSQARKNDGKKRQRSPDLESEIDSILARQYL